MKKLSAIFVAMAFCLALAVPAMAGDVSISGTYKLDGEYTALDEADTSNAQFDDDFELKIVVTEGDVSALVDFEISDDATFDGHDQTFALDNYKVTWKANDALTVMAGEYGLGYGRMAAIYNQGGHNIGVTYALEGVDLGFTLGKDTEGYDAVEGEDQDIDEYILSAAFKNTPFSKLAFYVAYQDNQVAEESDNQITVDWAIPAGPVGLAGELTIQGGDNLEGNQAIIEADFAELVGFDLGAILYYADIDFAPMGNDYAPLEWILDEIDDAGTDLTALILTAGYAYSDDLSFGAALVPYAQTTEDGDAVGMELDLNATYKLADNVTYSAALGYYAASDEVDPSEETYMNLFNRLTFTF